MPNADAESVTAVDVQLVQGLAQRVTAVRPDLVNAEATFGELAWNWGKERAGADAGRPRRLCFSGHASCITASGSGSCRGTRRS